MAIHSVQMTAGVESNATVDAIVVKAPNQLSAALAQHEKNVVIENEELSPKFARLLYWQQAARWWLIPILVYHLLASAITKDYKVEADWHIKWKLIETGGKIILTPKNK